MKRPLPLALIALTLPGCIGTLTPHQSMYAAYGAYDAALTGAVHYAESPNANPAIVGKMNATNRSEPVQAAVKYGKAYTRCLGSNTTITPGIDCTAFDFRPGTASGYARVLRSAVTALLAR
jgi:hypothetical protein